MTPGRRPAVAAFDASVIVTLATPLRQIQRDLVTQYSSNAQRTSYHGLLLCNNCGVRQIGRESLWTHSLAAMTQAFFPRSTVSTPMTS
jgi:hypothetical protein